MKNFRHVIDGKTYWISRSCSAVAVVFAIDKNRETYILANKRGSGAPDFVGYWNMPCGYIDYNESGEEAAVRETYEETGISLRKDQFILIDVNTNPAPEESNKQNITLRYQAIIPLEQYEHCLSNKNSEANEVDDIKFINIKDIGNYKWCFNHLKLIKKYYEQKGEDKNE